ncbi:formin-like protein 5 isoform X1 [Iris pallida]|uniref:Formin-like protein 5 isoform X1 n=1 Tax=Iris pallida TaxID=29817 RepID=A0AAX6DRV2_IRIPA|nr:formin-like protein 5 isoform X1 [Iris pallida]
MGSARVLPTRHEVPPPCVAIFIQGLRRKGGRPQRRNCSSRRRRRLGGTGGAALAEGGRRRADRTPLVAAVGARGKRRQGEEGSALCGSRTRRSTSGRWPGRGSSAGASAASPLESNAGGLVRYGHDSAGHRFVAPGRRNHVDGWLGEYGRWSFTVHGWF